MRLIRIAAAAGGALALTLGAGQAANAGTTLTGTATADNVFYAYVSTSPTTLGTLIGSGDSWSTSYSVASSTLSAGTYYLQIEATNQGGPAGFSGVFNLSGNGVFANGTQTLTTDPSNLSYWSGSYNDSSSNGSAQPWVAATGAVVQDTSYGWGDIAGTPNWIWPTAGGGGSPCQYCTVDLTAQFSMPGGVPEPATWGLTLLGLGGLGALLRRRRNVQPTAIAA